MKKRKRPVYILGISGGFSQLNQDSAAALLRNNEIVAAVEEERLVKVKHARGIFPKRSIEYCLREAGISIHDVDYLAFHLDSYPTVKDDLSDYIRFSFGYCPPIKLINHHMAHAASAFFLSGFDHANILTIDYSGDGISTMLAEGKDDHIIPLKVYRKPNSLGIFYALMTQYLGFKIDEDEYKVMGLASYGCTVSSLKKKVQKILAADETTYRFEEQMFRDTPSRQQKRFTKNLIRLLDTHRLSSEPVRAREKNIAYAAQKQFEEACIALLKDIRARVDSPNLCLAGGCALNCVMNAQLFNTGLVDRIYVPPVPGDNGASIGAALVVASELGFKFHRLDHPFLGPSYTNREIKRELLNLKHPVRYIKKPALLSFVARAVMQNKIVGWFQGRMEFGPRALGNRSILANPQNPLMKDILNKRIKFREDFRPFAPSVIEEEAEKYFDPVIPSPYMSFTFRVKTNKLPAITHVDGTARAQTVSQKENPLYYKLLRRIEKYSGMPVVLNTSLNVMDQPIVCTPKDAITVFAATGMDVLVLGNYVLEKKT